MNKIARVVAVAMVGVPLLIGGVAAHSTDAEAVTPTAPYHEYLEGAVTGTSTGSSGSTECGKPLSGRTGNWMCMDTSTNPTTTATTTHCIGNSCWYRDDDFHSGYSGSGYFGTFGKDAKTLGSCTFLFEVTLVGSQSTSKPVHLTCTTSINNIVFTGDRLYYSSAYPGGNTVNNGAQEKQWKHSATVAAGTTALWPKPGYVGYETTVAHGSVVHEWAWGKSGYSGYWYTYAKGVKFHRSVSGGTVLYRFGAVTDLGASPRGGGYRP